MVRHNIVKRSKKIRRGAFLLPTLMTTGNLILGCLVVACLFDRGTDLALTCAILILLAGLLDVFDGVVARATNTSSHFGMEFDSMADVVSFGVAPAWLLYIYCLDGFGFVGLAACVWYITCTAFRLARFNARVEDRVTGFSGLPSPAAAATIASFVILMETFSRLSFAQAMPSIDILARAVAPWVSVGLAGLGWLMVSRTPYLALKGIDFHRRRSIRLVLAAVVFGFVLWSLPQLLFPLALLYVFLGLVASFLTRVRWAEVVVPAWVEWAERMTADKPAVAVTGSRQGTADPKLPRLPR